MRKILLILFIGLAWGHNGQHIPLTPYISAGFKLGDHFEDTAPIFLGKTF